MQVSKSSELSVCRTILTSEDSNQSQTPQILFALFPILVMWGKKERKTKRLNVKDPTLISIPTVECLYNKGQLVQQAVFWEDRLNLSLKSLPVSSEPDCAFPILDMLASKIDENVKCPTSITILLWDICGTNVSWSRKQAFGKTV